MSRSTYARRPAFYLAAYSVINPWTLWLIRRSGLEDLHRTAPTEDDVLDPETVKLLPKHVELRRSR